MIIVSIVAIGRDKSIEVLKGVGIDVYIVDEESIKKDEIKAKITEALLTAKVVILEEDVREYLKDVLNQIVDKVKKELPIIVVPNIKKEETGRLIKLRELISKAIGVELKWKR